jgi:hypothetical protein
MIDKTQFCGIVCGRHSQYGIETVCPTFYDNRRLDIDDYRLICMGMSRYMLSPICGVF